MENGQQFFFYSKNKKINRGIVWHCDNCTQVCATNVSKTTRKKIEHVYSGSVSKIFTLPDQRKICSRCNDVFMKLPACHFYERNFFYNWDYYL